MKDIVHIHGFCVYKCQVYKCCRKEHSADYFFEASQLIIVCINEATSRYI